MELDAVSLNATAQALVSGRDDARSHSSLPPNPFVGLRPFESGEGLLFFGRREQIIELLQQLHRTRFLSIVGSSGCGKSSLIRAGLIPKLKAGFLIEDKDQWLKATMKPGDAPLYNLAQAVLGALSGEPPADAEVSSLVEEIEVSGLQALVERLTPRLDHADTNFLLLVDQFEEIFRFGSYAEDDAQAYANADPARLRVEATDRERRRDEAAEFVSLMLGLAQQKTLPIYVVMTMRSDFLGDCDAFYDLPQAMNRSQYLVPRLTRQQRQEAIENPIRLYGAQIAPRLLDRLLNDVGDDSDQLPVMQHALMRTWEEWQRHRSGAIDIHHYEAVGTIKDALWRDADKALEGMSERELIITAHLFQALTDVDAKGRRLRRPAKFSEVQAITGASAEEVDRIVERFRSDNRSFLTKTDERLEDDPLIDISHESLIRQWKKLRDWVDVEAESREQYTRLAGAALRYYAPKRTEAPWSDPPLQVALDWREKHKPNEAWARRYHPAFADAMKFLDESLAKREADAAAAELHREMEAQRERDELEKAKLYAEQQRKSAHRLRFLTVGLLIFSLLAALTAYYAVSARRKMNATQAAAETAREANKAYNRTKIKEAREKFLEAIEQYRALKDMDAVAFFNGELGNMLLEQETKDEVKLGLAYLEEASKVYRQNNNIESWASTLIKIGEALLANEVLDIDDDDKTSTPSAPDAGGTTKGAKEQARRGRFTQALGRYCSALEGFKSAGNPEGQIKAYTAIGQFFDRINEDIKVGDDCPTLNEALLDKPGEENNYRQKDKSIKAFSQTLPLYRQLIRQQVGDQEEVGRLRGDLAKMLLIIGNRYMSIKEPQSAKDMYETALAIYREIGDGEKEAELLADIGSGLVMRAPEEGEKYLLRAADAYRRLGDFRAEARALVSLGRATDPFEDKDGKQQQKTLDVLNRAIAIYEGLKDRQGMAFAYKLIAGMQSRTNPAAALQTYRQALSLYEAENDLSGQVSTHDDIADLQEKQGQYAQAIESYTKAAELVKSGGPSGFTEYVQEKIDALKAKMKGSPK